MAEGATDISIDRVSHIYRPARGRAVTALEDVSLEVRDREFVAILGPSGCGKSTLLYLIGGFLPIEAGSIRVAGAPIAGPGPDRGIVFQHSQQIAVAAVEGGKMQRGVSAGVVVGTE